MSYILDALRKADAQRERDPARGIHAQPLQGLSDSREPARSRTLLWGGGVAAVVVVAIGAWYAMRAQPVGTGEVPVAAATTTVPQAMPSQPAPQPAPQLASETPPRPADAIAPPAPALVPAVAEDGLSARGQRAIRIAQVTTPPAVPMAAPTATPVPSAATALPAATPTTASPVAPPPVQTGSAAVSSPLSAAQPPMPLPQTTPVAPAAPPSPNAAQPGIAPLPNRTQPPSPFPQPAPFPQAAPRAPVPPAAPMPAVAGLPADAPKLTITGGVYSADRSQRMLIVNGQVAKEGADLGSGVRLDEIQPKAAVLHFRGTRYVVGY